MLSALARLWLYLGATIVIGDTALRLAGVPRRPETLQRASRLVLVGWCGSVFALALLFVIQAYDMELAASLADVRPVLTGTTWGRGWSLLMLFAVVGTVTHALAAPSWLRAVWAVAVAVTMGGLGHAAADEAWPLLSRALDALHVLGVGAWIGGLLLVAAAQPGDSVTWAAFSRLATVTAPIVIASGVGAAFRRLSAARLVDIVGSDYGRLLAFKVVLVVVVLGFGFVHRRRVTARALPSAHALRTELYFAAAVFIATSVLAGSAPPGE